MKEGKIPFEREVLSTEDHVNEYLLTTLRTQWGSDLVKLKQEYGYDVLGQHGVLINDLLAYSRLGRREMRLTAPASASVIRSAQSRRDDPEHHRWRKEPAAESYDQLRQPE